MNRVACHSMKMPKLALPLIACFVLAAPHAASAWDLKQQTVDAWDAYVHSALARMKTRLTDGDFLWSDETSEIRQRVKDGEIVVSPMRGNGRTAVPRGLIHHWIGAVFIPNTSLDDVLAVLHDYDHYKDFYPPTVADSKCRACAASPHEYFLRLFKKVMFITSVTDVEYESPYFRIDDHRSYSLASSTSVREVQDYGKPTESRGSPGHGNGYLWRMQSISRYQKRDGGVFMELEALALSRDIPFSYRWLVSPIVSQLSRSELSTSLGQSRDAVRQKQHPVAPEVR